MLESVTVPRFGRRWLTFDVTPAVVEWMKGEGTNGVRNHQGGEIHDDDNDSYGFNPEFDNASDFVHAFPNLGLVVEVEDELESRLDAAELLALRNCSKDDKGIFGG